MIQMVRHTVQVQVAILCHLKLSLSVLQSHGERNRRFMSESDHLKKIQWIPTHAVLRYPGARVHEEAHHDEYLFTLLLSSVATTL